MEEGCLITGKSTDLLAEIVQSTANEGYKPLVARSGHTSFDDDQTASTITWNRRSALSARSVILHAQNVLGDLPRAVVIFSAVRDTTPFHESSIVSLENRVDAEIKGFLFLLRELLSHFHKRRAGSLTLAVHEGGDPTRSPAESVSLSAFMGLAESLSRHYKNEALSMRLCYSAHEDIAGYAQFVLDCLAAPPSKKAKTEWLVFPQKRLFGAK
jgi:hypothetical protein